jgi:sphingosine kinase
VPNETTFSPVLTLKAYRFSISIKTEMTDKETLVKSLREYTSSAPHYDVPPVEEGDATALPPLQYIDKQDGWITFEGPILFMYAGKGPLVSR